MTGRREEGRGRGREEVEFLFDADGWEANERVLLENALGRRRRVELVRFLTFASHHRRSLPFLPSSFSIMSMQAYLAAK